MGSGIIGVPRYCILSLVWGNLLSSMEPIPSPPGWLTEEDTAIAPSPSLCLRKQEFDEALRAFLAVFRQGSKQPTGQEAVPSSQAARRGSEDRPVDAALRREVLQR